MKYSIACACAALLVGCSLLLQTAAPEQCRADADCATRGARVCEQGFCVRNTDAAAEAEANPSDAGMLDGAVDAKPIQVCPLTNYVKNFGFENGLQAWKVSPTTSAAQAVLDPHSGTQAYAICDSALYQSDLQIPPGKVLTRIWVKSAPPASASARIVVAVANAQTSPLSISPTWTCIENESFIYAGGRTDVYLIAKDPTDAGPACAAFDDMAIWLIPDGGLPPECQCPKP
jgi:hypothetical protein